MIEKFYASTAPKLYSMQVQDSDFEFQISMHVHLLPTLVLGTSFLEMTPISP